MPFFGCLRSSLMQQLLEPVAVLGQVDHVRRGAEDRNAGLFQRVGELQRRLAAELHDHAEQLALGLFELQDLQHVFGGQRLEIEPVRGVVVGRHRLRVAVDHDRFEAGVLAARRRRDSSNSRTRCPGRSGSARRRGSRPSCGRRFAASLAGVPANGVS
jgi:hypothetical protein